MHDSHGSSWLTAPMPHLPILYASVSTWILVRAKPFKTQQLSLGLKIKLEESSLPMWEQITDGLGAECKLSRQDCVSEESSSEYIVGIKQGSISDAIRHHTLKTGQIPSCTILKYVVMNDSLSNIQKAHDGTWRDGSAVRSTWCSHGETPVQLPVPGSSSSEPPATPA